MDIVEADVWGIPAFCIGHWPERTLTFALFCVAAAAAKRHRKTPGMTEKLERLVSSGVEVVHIGVCAQPKGIRCQTMERHAAWLEEHRIRVVWKTH